MIRTFLIFSLVLLAGCASSVARPDAKARAEAELVCKDKEQCAAYWKAAEAWLTKNSNFKIKSVSNRAIETDGPKKNAPELAFLVSKTRNAQGNISISVVAGCDNMYGCRPNALNAIADLKDFMRASVATPAQGEPAPATPTELR